MKLLHLSSIAGPNIYSYHPVIVMEVDLEDFMDCYTNEIPGFNFSLLHHFPALKKHHCCKNYAGGFLERLQRGTLLGHVMEHLALELQSQIAKPVYFGKTRYAPEFAGYRIVFSYHHEALGKEAGKAAFELISRLATGREFSLEQVMSKLEEAYQRTSYGPSTEALLRVAKKRHIPILPLSQDSSLIQLGYGARQQRIQATTTGQTSSIGVDLACDKLAAKELFVAAGLPVARGWVTETEEMALKYFEKINSPVVIKPRDGNQGKGVTLQITTPWELKRAFELSKIYAEKVLVEEYIEGEDYRLTVVNGQMVAAAHRIPPFVIGDGVHNIRQLIQNINADEMRGEGHEKPLTRIKIDQVVLLTLARQELKLETVLPKGERVFLRDNGNLSTGGTARDVTELVHPENKLLVERATRVVGLDIAGIDLRTVDISRPISSYGGAIIEINAAPGIRMHHYPSSGQSRDVAGQIIDMLFPTGDGRIPIFAVTGTNGKTTTVRLLQHILRELVPTVGMTTTDGIYLNQQLIKAGDTTGPWSARMILQDSKVDLAVLEVARGGMIKRGLGYDQSDVGIILNISEDHLEMDGVETLEDLAHIKSLVVETVKENGISVLNADNPYTASLSSRARGEIIYFSSNPQNAVIGEHMAMGGRGVVVKNELLSLYRGAKIYPLLNIKEIPMTWKGKAVHQVENVLAAVAALYGYGVNKNVITQGLVSFGRDVWTNPGRLNLVQGNGWQVIVDYGHNLEGYRALLHFAKRLGYRRLLGVIGVPGDRSDRSIQTIGRLAGDFFDQLWIKEDQELRGRQGGEVARLLEIGLLEGGKQPKFDIILNEGEAVQAMLKNLKIGDLGIIFYEKEPERLLYRIGQFIADGKEDKKNRVFAVNSSR